MTVLFGFGRGSHVRTLLATAELSRHRATLGRWRVTSARNASGQPPCSRLRRMVGRGERPGYRLRAAQDGAWTVVGLPGVTVTAETKRAALTAARTAIAAVLEVPRDAFDLEVA